MKTGNLANPTFKKSHWEPQNVFELWTNGTNDEQSNELSSGAYDVQWNWFISQHRGYVDMIHSPAVSQTGSLWWLTVGAPLSGLISGLLLVLDLPLRLLSSVRLPSPPSLLCGVTLCVTLPLLGLCWSGQQNPCTMTRVIIRWLLFITLILTSKTSSGDADNINMWRWHEMTRDGK